MPLFGGTEVPESDAQNVSGQVLAGAEIPEGGGEGPYLSMATLKLQALVYDILPSRKVPEIGARSVGYSHHQRVFCIRVGSDEDRFNSALITTGH